MSSKCLIVAPCRKTLLVKTFLLVSRKKCFWTFSKTLCNKFSLFCLPSYVLWCDKVVKNCVWNKSQMFDLQCLNVWSRPMLSRSTGRGFALRMIKHCLSNTSNLLLSQNVWPFGHVAKQCLSTCWFMLVKQCFMTWPKCHQNF